MKLSAILLNRAFDVARLQQDFLAVQGAGSMPAGYAGEGHHAWDGITLFSNAHGGDHLLDRTPYIKEIVNELQFKLNLARFLMLSPGGVIKPHKDAFLTAGLVRLHIPVITHPDVRFVLDGERCDWRAGQFWFGDFTRMHYGENLSDITRVHLVLDVESSPALVKLFPADAIPAAVSATCSAPTGIYGKYECDFVLPAGFALAGFEPSDTDLEGSIRARNDRLWIFINGQPLLEAVAVDAVTLELIGLTIPVRLHLTFSDDDVVGATLSTPDGTLRIELPVHAAHRADRLLST
jgi:hypothetical protein